MDISGRDLAVEQDLLAAIDELSPFKEFISYPDFGGEVQSERLIRFQGSAVLLGLIRPDYSCPYQPRKIVLTQMMRFQLVNRKLRREEKKEHEVHYLLLVDGVSPGQFPRLVKGAPPLHVMILDDFLRVVQETMAVSDLMDYLVYRSSSCEKYFDWEEEDLLASFLLEGRPLQPGVVEPEAGLWKKAFGEPVERAWRGQWDEPKAYFCEDIIQFCRAMAGGKKDTPFSRLALELNSFSYAQRIEFGASIIRSTRWLSRTGNPCNFVTLGADGDTVIVFYAGKPGPDRRKRLQELCRLARYHYRAASALGVAACHEELLRSYQVAESRGKWVYDPEMQVEAVGKIATF